MGLSAGATFGPYRIMGSLGRGGMASVYKAYEAGLDRYVALKVLPAESVQDESSAERFRREARVIARLEHPNITPLFAYGIDDGLPWMAMRMIAGGSLSAVLKAQRLSTDRAIAILRGVADALDYAHAKGVVHRDVKPQNVLLDESGRVYLADFGIARLTETATVLTAAGLITGTPQYMAPEQATGKPVDSRADIYALGIMAYEMLTGRVPFSADTPVAVLMKHVSEPIPIPSPADVAEPLARALLKALAKAPADRWQTAGEFVHALERGLQEVPTLAPAPLPTMDMRAPAREATTARTSAPTVVRGPATTAAGAALSPTLRGPTATLPGAPTPLPTQPWMAAPPPVAPALHGEHPHVEPVVRRRSPLPFIVGGAGLLAVAMVIAVIVLQPWGAPASPLPAASAAALPPPVAPVFAPVPTMADAPATLSNVPAVTPPAPTMPPVAVARPTPAAAVRPAPVQMPVAPPVAPPRPVATGSLRLDVDAVQAAYGDTASLLFLQVRVDGRPLKTLALTFDGRDAFTRSRKRQAFEVPGVPVGARRISLVASRSQDLGGQRAEGATQMTVEEGMNRAYVQVRFMGGGDTAVRFR